MLRFLFLVSCLLTFALVFCLQDNWGQIRPPGKIDAPVLSSRFKGLIRDSWGLARRNPDIAPNVLLRMIDVHPETQKLFPRLIDVPRPELHTSRVFLQASYNCFFGITWIVKNLDDTELIGKQLWKHASTAWYTLEPTTKQQLDETTRIFLEVMKKELGDAFTNEHAHAWQELFDKFYEVLVKNNEDRPLSEDDKKVLRDTWGIAKQNPRFGSNAFLKFLKAHPDAQSYLPILSNIPISQLAENKEFIAYGSILNQGISAILENMDDPDWRDERFKGKDLNQYYAPNIPTHVQDQETTRILLDALDEELGPRFTKTTREVWTRAVRHFNKLFSEYVV